MGKGQRKGKRFKIRKQKWSTMAQQAFNRQIGIYQKLASESHSERVIASKEGKITAVEKVIRNR